MPSVRTRLSFIVSSIGAPGMVGVMMRVDHVFDRLVGRKSLRCGYRRHRHTVSPRRLDHDNVVLEFDENASLAIRVELPDAVGKLDGLSGRSGGWRCRRRRGGRACNRVNRLLAV